MSTQKELLGLFTYLANIRLRAHMQETWRRFASALENDFQQRTDLLTTRWKERKRKINHTYRWVTIVNGSCRTWSMTAHSSSVCCLSWAGEHIWKRRAHHSV